MTGEAKAQEIRDHYGISFEMKDPKGGDEYEAPYVEIEVLFIPKEKRGQGIATDVMFDLIRWADSNGYILALDPSSDFGSSVARLRKFYGQFGFVGNKGRNKDFRTRYAMIRQPKKRADKQMKELNQLVENFFQPKRNTLGLDQLVEMVEQVMDEAADAASKAEVSERQERGMINAINQHASEENPITVNAGDGQIENVIGAKKMEGCNQFGCEMYTDVIVHTKEGKVNVSCKGTSAPSIAGGGLLGAKALIPDIIPNFLAAAENWYLDKGYKEGDIIPDLYGKLNDRDKRIAVIGTVEIGGPIDYMYVGPMDVESSFDNGVLTLSGDLVEAEEYADVHDIYFRIRKRRNDQPFVPGEKDKNGYPVILGRSPSKGDKGRRIVFVNKVPESRDIVEF